MQLEHCPFCGTNHTLIPDGSGRYQQIVCGACGARGPEVYRTLPYAIAVESWNVRQGPSDVNTTHRTSGATPPVEVQQRENDRFAFQQALYAWREARAVTGAEFRAVMALYDRLADGVSASVPHPLPAQANDGGEHA